MKNWMIALLCLSALTARAEDNTVLPLNAPAADAATPAAVAQGDRLTFIDSRIFDVELFRLLQDGKHEVEVSVAGNVPLSSIPPRLDRWITTAAETGKVEIVQQPAARFFAISLISMAFSSMGLLEKFREESAYKEARKYDVKIYYRKALDGNVFIERLVFVRHP